MSPMDTIYYETSEDKTKRMVLGSHDSTVRFIHISSLPLRCRMHKYERIQLSSSSARLLMEVLGAARVDLTI